MRRVAALLALLTLCLGTAGCGGHDDKSVTPLDDALGYFSKDAPFVAAVETDPNGSQIKQVAELLGRFPVGDILRSRLQAVTKTPNLNWERDVRPQLGAPLVIGLLRPAAGRAISTATVVAMRVNHPLRAQQVLLRQPGFRGHGKSSGVRIYENVAEHRFAAVDGDVLVAASDRGILEQALSIKRGDNRMREAGFTRDLTKLPTGGLARISADPRALLGADPRLRPALAVKWIASLRRLGAVLKASSDGLTLDFRLASDRRAISNADLPLAPKPAGLPLIGGRGELQLGIREPGRLARLAFAVANAIAPRRMALLRALEPHGIDLERQVQHHLADVGVLAWDPVSHKFAARAQLNESGDVKAALGQLAPVLPGVAALFGIKGLGVATPQPGESFYALALPNGKMSVFGVVGNALVAASEARRAADLASEATHTAPGGAEGAAVFTVNARELAGRLLAKQLSGPAALFAPLAVASLRDLTGTLTISRGALTGHAKLTIVK
jgi:Protein of unknown function (DUF3352)